MKRASRLALVLSLGLSVAAQAANGRLYASVRDESGAALPGASAMLTGSARTLSTESDGRGEFRFLYLEHGPYTLTVSHAGFARRERQVVITTGESLQLEIVLRVVQREERITVSADSPVLDVRKFGSSTTLTRDELHRVPNSRDPWAVLRTIPGVVVDRMNIAGNESGQQSLFQGKGTDVADTTWSIDGVLFEDPNALGTSPGYHDFGAFEQIAVSTGGKGVESQTGGVDLQFVVKRGTNRWHGSARGYLTHDRLQWSNVRGTELEGDPPLPSRAGSRARRRAAGSTRRTPRALARATPSST
jgi:hypothetical protein